MRNEWSGDVDLGDGELKSRHSKYVKYLEFVCSIGLKGRTSTDDIKEDLGEMCSKLSIEKEFLISGYEDAKKEYKSAQETASATEKTLFACAWKVEEYSKLLEKNASLSQSLNNVISIINSGVNHSLNIGATLASLRKELLDYVKGI